MNLRFETERLLIRPFEITDNHALFELNSDEEVMRYTGDVVFKDLNEVDKLIAEYTSDKGPYQTTDMGRLAVIRKSDGEFLGWNGLKYHPEKDFVDIGYRFLRRYWGNGYATESGLKILEHAFNDHQLSNVVAQIHESNIGSQIVALKLGMQLRYRFLWDHREPGRWYQLDKDEYNN